MIFMSHNITRTYFHVFISLLKRRKHTLKFEFTALYFHIKVYRRSNQHNGFNLQTSNINGAKQLIMLYN